MIYKWRIRNIGMLFFITSLMIYLTFHAVSGERGIIALFKLSSLRSTLESELEDTRLTRMNIEHKVNLLRSDSLDLDLLDEQARKVMGLARKDETVYFIDHKGDL